MSVAGFFAYAFVSVGVLSSPFPVPMIEESFPAYTERWNAWLDSIPHDELRYAEVLRINRMCYEAAGRDFPSLQPDPTRSEQDFRTSKEFVKSHPELAKAIREMPGSPHLGASPYGEDAAMYQSHRREMGFEINPIADPLNTPLDILLPQISDLDRLIRIAVLDAYVAIDENDASRSIASIRAAMELIECLEEPPTFVGYQVQLARFVLVSTAVEHILRSGSLTDDQLLELQRSIDVEFIPIDAATRFELWVARQTIEWIFADASVDGFLTTFGLSRWYEIDSMMRWDRDPFAFTARAFGTATIQQHRRAVDRLWDAAVLDLENYRKSAAVSHYERVSSELLDQRRFGPLRTILSNAHPYTMRRRLSRGEVRIGSTQLAIATHRHKARHGEYPASLDTIDRDLITADPIDVYTGDPLLYRLTESGPLIYSAGPDRDDDGAAKETEDPSWMPLDELREILATHPDSIDGDIILFGTP